MPDEVARQRSHSALVLGAIVLVAGAGFVTWKFVLEEKPVEKKTVNAADLPSPVEKQAPDPQPAAAIDTGSAGSAEKTELLMPKKNHK